jgi:hypothetical protein
MATHPIIKYPRTRHVEGSRLQRGDEDLDVVPLSQLYGKHLIIEEKVDGANSGISFDATEHLLLQSRGHYLAGGPREAQFTLFKQWAATHAETLYCALGDRYIAYGEWLYSKHTVFYDRLPHFWMEFDILDRAQSAENAPVFLDTHSRAKLLAGAPIIPVRVLWEGTWTRDLAFADFIVNSHFKSSEWLQSLQRQVNSLGQNWPLIWKHTDHSDRMEGLYIKWEEDGRVKDRYKFVRPDFVSLLVDNATHHMDLPMTPNVLEDGVDIFA